jgi:hypothetical protein
VAGQILKLGTQRAVKNHNGGASPMNKNLLISAAFHDKPAIGPACDNSGSWVTSQLLIQDHHPAYVRIPRPPLIAPEISPRTNLVHAEQFLGLDGEGLARSLARPGGNVTGVTLYGTELAHKRMEIFKEAAAAGRLPMEVTRVRIIDAGRRALVRNINCRECP